MLHRAMVDNNYVQPIGLMMTPIIHGRLGYLATTTLLNVGLLAARGQAGIERLYSALTMGRMRGRLRM